MEQLPCPRCQELFERSDRFCKKCGLRKSKPFSQKQWWSVGLLTNLLIVLLCVVLREKIITSEGYQPDITTGVTWLMFGILGLFLLIPTFFLYQISRILWLRMRGLVGSGEVVAHREYAAPKGRTREVSVVEFTPDLAQSSVCQVEDWAWVTSLSLHEKVKVLYDPYNPGGCAWVGSGLIDLMLFGFFGLVFSSLPVIGIVLVLRAPPMSV
ncbi:MAG: hypothetical protein ABI456_16270 [Ktedonobacteraceae bacterium]|nr:DUF3592 domain-containing protein [Chloroflexota bacterium]